MNLEHIQTALMILIGFWLGRTWINLRDTKRYLAIQQERLNEAFSERVATYSALNALRRNAYLTDKDGVRRHYSKVSAEVRERAETN